MTDSPPNPLPSADRPAEIRAMFTRIAGAYDLNNRLHSLWRDQAWRKAAAKAAATGAGQAVLDAACGTGDLAARFARQGARVVGLDFCPEMLAIARRKFPALGIDWVLGDAMHMPFKNETFDAVSIAFGLRNLPDAPAALAEFHRVLRPGGRLVVLEFSGGKPRGLSNRLLRFYTDRVMSVTAALLARDRRGAYRYLADSIREFLTPTQLAAALEAAGFRDVATRPLSCGLASLHVARRD